MNETLAQQIKNALKARGQNTKHLAALLKLSVRQTQHRLKENNLSADQIEQVARHLDWDFEHIANAGERMRNAQILEFFKNTSLTVDLLERVDGFKERGPNEMVLLVQTMLEQLPLYAEKWGTSSTEVSCELLGLILDLVGPVEPTA